MITLDEALARIQRETRPLPSETVEIPRARGRILAEPVTALRTQPPFDASAMDGYAVRSQDLTEDSVTLVLAGESAAGHAARTMLGAGECVRISTGAVMPPGADQVVMQENCEREGEAIRTSQVPEAGHHVRKAGIDFAAGDILLETGAQLSPAAISLAVSGGIQSFTVSRQPRVGVLSTGDELVEAGQETAPDQIINSLGPGLSALIAEWGGQPHYLGIARDDPADIRDKLAAAMALDLLVTIGGASVGDHDHLRRVFSEQGGELFFEKIAIKPGKPTWFGVLDGTLVLGLPGNPVSAMVMAALCLKPVMDHLRGLQTRTKFRTAKLSVNLPANGPRVNMMRAKLHAETGLIAPLGQQDSSALSALVAANALIRRPSSAEPATVGDVVEYWPLDSV
jgi:molybdopterin molybdotransferase